MDVLRACGVEPIHVAAGYRAEQIEALGVDVTVNPRFASTNMVATLFCARQFFVGETDLVISYGDIIYQPENLQAVLNCGSDIALMIDLDWRRYWESRMDDPLSDAETLLIDREGYVTELGKKPERYDQIQGQYTGLIKIRGDRIRDMTAFFDGLDRSLEVDGKPFDGMYMTSFLQLLIDAGWPVEAVGVSNGWLEVDTVEDLECYHAMVESGNLSSFCTVDPA